MFKVFKDWGSRSGVSGFVVVVLGSMVLGLAVWQLFC